MGASYSKGEKVYRAARANDVRALQALLRDVGRNSGALLEYRDPQGFTPLVAAANKGNASCIELLLRAGADVHALTDKPNQSNALHEAAAHGHIRVVEILLAAGANPFVENAKGLTAVDVAINQRSVALIRKLESRAPFAGYLALKTPRYMGLSTEWKSRWCVIMPRYPAPNANLPAEQRVVRSLLVVYKAADQYQPICKAWLDGAVARTVVGSRGAAQLQCALALHRSHAPPGGAHVTGDHQGGYTLHMRPAYGNPEHVANLRRFMELCNMGAGGLMAGGQAGHQRNNSAPVGGQQWAGGSPAGTPTWQQQGHSRHPSGVPPVPQHFAGGMTPPQGSPSTSRPAPDKAATLGPLLADPGMSDEQMAHRLQHAFDQEAAQHNISNPYEAQRAYAQQGAPGSSGGAGANYPAINHTGSASMPPGPLQASASPIGHVHSSSDVASAYPRLPGQRLQQQASAPPMPARSASGSPQPSRQQSTQPPDSPAPIGATTSLESAMAWWNQLPSAGTPPQSALSSTQPGFPGGGMGSNGGSADNSAAPTARMDVARAHSTAASEPGSGGMSTSDDEAMCVVCLEQPASAGFVHGDSVHKCCCRNCAADLKQANYPTCPMCRQRIEHIILNFY